ncbi:MAG: hypothetical protein WC740_19955 [Verrucomicrobiia bacterium]
MASFICATERTESQTQNSIRARIFLLVLGFNSATLGDLTMNRLTALLTAACLLTSLSVWAQDPPKRERNGSRNVSAPAAGRTLGMFGLPSQVGEKMKLTNDQKQKAMQIAQKYRPQLEEIRKKMLDDFRCILTDEQKKTLDEAIEQRHRRSQQGRGESGRPPGDGGERKTTGNRDKE